MARKYKPNNTYILEIHGCQYYIGCHTQQEEMTEADILNGSGNSLRVVEQKSLITHEEYKECCRVVYIEEYDTPEEAKNREAELIEKFRNHYGDRCLNKGQGNKYGSTGLTRSEETKKKNSESHGVNGVRQYDLNGNFIKEYPSISEASRQTGIKRGSISHCLTGYRKTAGKSLWKYA